MEKVQTRKLVILFCSILFTVSISACGVTHIGIKTGGDEPQVKTKPHGPPPHAPAHGYRAKYAYYYYPDAYVYYCASRKQYFFLEGERWIVSVSLPQRVLVRLGTHVVIEMDSERPYRHFSSHKKKYPPGQMKKKDKWAKKKKY
jgi:hypothetical protein